RGVEEAAALGLQPGYVLAGKHSGQHHEPVAGVGGREVAGIVHGRPAPGGANPRAASSSTRTQSIPGPRIGGTNSCRPLRGNSPMAMACPVRGSNQKALIVVPDRRSRSAVTGCPVAR